MFAMSFEEAVVSILSEGVAVTPIFDQLKNGKMNLVKINYLGDTGVPQGERTIEPYLLGTTIAGNLAIRAYQTTGVTQTEQPGWKIFLIDKIVSWQVLQETFTIRDDYERVGDKMFGVVRVQLRYANNPPESKNFFNNLLGNIKKKF